MSKPPWWFDVRAIATSVFFVLVVLLLVALLVAWIYP